MLDSHEDIFFELDDLRELPVEYDEIYLDSLIFSNKWVQLESLIQDDKRVHYFARQSKSKVGRVTKIDKGDAYLLHKVYELY